MKKLDKDIKKNKIKDTLSSVILEIIYEAEKLLTSFSIQQYVLHDYYYVLKEDKKSVQEYRNKKHKIQKTLYYLKQAGYINFNDKNYIKLNTKGLYKTILNKSQKMKLNRKKGNNFYLVIFDIPEEYSKIRDLFRKILYNFGAELLQKSVFTLKDPQAYIFIKDLVRQSKISDYIKIITCNKVE